MKSLLGLSTVYYPSKYDPKSLEEISYDISSAASAATIADMQRRLATNANYYIFKEPIQI